MTSRAPASSISRRRGAYGPSGLRARPVHGARIADYEPGASFGPRVLPAYEWVWLLHGSAEWSGTVRGGQGHRDVAERLVPGRLLLARPGIHDSYVWDHPSGSRHAYIHFVVESAPGTALPETTDWPTVRDFDALPLLGALCQHLIDLAGSTEVMASARTEQVLTLLLETFVAGPVRSRPPLHPHLAELVRTVEEIWATDGLRIVEAGELADRIGLSVGHLFRLFAAEFGCGLATALELVRLSRAATLLQRSNETLSRVAEQTGFANAYHLSRRFRAAYGRPPGEYRRAGTQADPMAPLTEAGLAGLASMLLNASSRP